MTEAETAELRRQTGTGARPTYSARPETAPRSRPPQVEQEERAVPALVAERTGPRGENRLPRLDDQRENRITSPLSGTSTTCSSTGPVTGKEARIYPDDGHWRLQALRRMGARVVSVAEGEVGSTSERRVGLGPARGPIQWANSDRGENETTPLLRVKPSSCTPPNPPHPE